MARVKVFLLAAIFLVGSTAIYAKSLYSRRLCRTADYTCVRVKKGQTWKTLWPDPQMRRIVMRVNRRTLRLYPGLTIAVPNNLYDINHMDISPFPYFMDTKGKKLIVLDLRKHAFGAYDGSGYLVHWGPASGGKGWCPDVNRRCTTPRGSFFIFRKGDVYCKSTKFPIPEGGAPMNFCMYFYKGFAMHAGDLPGFHASHGCVRLFFEDAEWLNLNFITVGALGTKVIVR